MDAQEAPIRHLVVLGHPGPQSFNHTIAAAYADAVRSCRQEAIVRDLYALDFDPRLKASERSVAGATGSTDDVGPELELLRDSAVVTLVYPIWFGMPPAIIKGYVDRVLGAGFVARNLESAPPDSPLQGKKLMLFTSSASTRPWLEEQGQWLGLRQTFDLYLETVFGFSEVRHVHFDAIVEGTQKPYVGECRERTNEAARALCAALLHERRHIRFDHA